MKRTPLLLVLLAVIPTACSEPHATQAPATTAIPLITTTVPESTTTAAEARGIVPGEDVGVDAVVLAYQTVFSSVTDYGEKASYLEDPEGLEETVAEYRDAGESLGGVDLAPTSVVINGDTADVTYDLLFGGTPTYPDLTGDAVLLDDTWKITREMFCAMMASARVSCPEA